MSDLGVAVVIEDDADMRNLLEAVLNQAGFEVYSACDGREGVDVVRDKQPGIVTLDVGLPDIDGFEVLRRIREFSTAYVVMLTGRTAESDLLTALQGGADDYIMKPFRPREMRARIAAMMRRPRNQPPRDKPGTSDRVTSAPAEVPEKGTLQHNGLTLNLGRRTVAVRGSAVDLTRSEFDLLHELLRGAGAIRTRADLVGVIRADYHREEQVIEGDERAVEVHMGNLRRKLGENPSTPRWVQTVRGVGYRLTTIRPENPDTQA